MQVACPGAVRSRVWVEHTHYTRDSGYRAFPTLCPGCHKDHRCTGHATSYQAIWTPVWLTLGKCIANTETHIHVHICMDKQTDRQTMYVQNTHISRQHKVIQCIHICVCVCVSDWTCNSMYLLVYDNRQTIYVDIYCDTEIAWFRQ